MRNLWRPFGFGLTLHAAIALITSPRAIAQPPSDFEKVIRPIMERSCWNCHGEAVQLSSLDLRTRDGALEGGARGPAIVPGRADESRLYRVVAGLEQPSMPMEGDTLSDEEVAAVRNWINGGAHWDTGATTTAADALEVLEGEELSPDALAAAREYWAFQLPVQAPLPDNADVPHLENPIDLFLERARRDKGVHAAPRADRATLVRRAYLDLIGLPPTPEEARAFLDDTGPGAWPQLIDRLLASPHYGERWGRHWLDVARYADSSGFEHDRDRPNAWRYRDYVIESFNEDKPYDRFIKEQVAGDELDDASHETRIATGFLRAGPRVLFREKDNPERRHDYLDDVLATIGRGVLGLTVHCARCHDHKFDPIPQRDYYRLQASIFGYVETEYPLLSPEEVDAYVKKNAEIDARQQALQEEISAIEAPYRHRLQLEELRERFPAHVQRAVLKPDDQRTPGEKLLAVQVLSVGVDQEQVDAALTPEDSARRQALNNRREALENERPEKPAMAEIVTDGDYRYAPDGFGDEIVGCPECRVGPDEPGSFLHEGPGRYEAPPSYFLIRGDPFSKGSLMSPGFVSVATYDDPPTEIQRPDGRTSGRRLALAEWLVSPSNPLTARVMVNRIWHHHFGRGIVATLDNFGKVGERPSHPELLDWLAVEFMKRGFRIKEMHRLMMTSEAYQMASTFEDATSRERDPANHYLWKYRPHRLEAEIVRDSIMAASGSIDLTIGGPPVFPYVPQEILASQAHGTWRNQPDGPDAWRRSVYVYRRRSLGFPFFDTFDLPDQNVTAAARNVSTVPTQALTLLNNPFVLRQARRFAERLEKEIPDGVADLVNARVDRAFRIALARPPTQEEAAIARELIERGSLIDLTHVMLNLNEFLYLR
ncbi:MAG TPA: PSD1 and planctomycete cytochrome C domain-containing protein [Vicinamibacteria bacterium]|nr:PSD1 and planctomycete cytochrome C domain-containing protein [Vicinamibacteria bacterium]